MCLCANVNEGENLGVKSLIGDQVKADQTRQQETEKETIAATPDITQLLQAWCAGDQSALEQLIPLVEEELRRLAHYYLRKERQGHLLQTAALVGEAYLRLTKVRPAGFDGRADFYALSAQIMRRILVARSIYPVPCPGDPDAQ